LHKKGQISDHTFWTF